MSDSKSKVATFVCGGPPKQPYVAELPEGPCPKCGGELVFGFGLAGGGYGAYVACDTDDCDFFAKKEAQE